MPMHADDRPDAAAKRPLGVLHVLGYAGVGARASGVTGVERVIESLLAGLGAGFRQTVVYPPAGLLHARFGALAARVVPAAPRRHLDLAFLRALEATIHSDGIDVVLSHGARFDLHAAIAARRTRIAHVVRRPVAFADERFPPGRRAVYARVDAWTLRHAHAIVAVSEASKRRMVATQRLEPARIEVIPNGVVPPAVDDVLRLATRRALGAGDHEAVIGGVGQLIARKAFRLVVEAAAQARAGGAPDLLVCLVGEGPERAALAALAQSRGVRLVLPGFQEEPQHFMAAFDAFVLPSHAEGLPLALLEAMALGVACVATPAAGSAEAIEDGVSGLLVPFDDVPALAQALRRLLGDEALRRRLGAAAATRVAARYSPQAMWDGYRTVLQRAVAFARRTPN